MTGGNRNTNKCQAEVGKITGYTGSDREFCGQKLPGESITYCPFFLMLGAVYLSF